MAKVYNYLRIYNSLKADIQAKRYQVGEQLPTEAELQQIYGVSRITVKKAMEMLSDERLVERFSGKGTFVRACAEEKKSQTAASEKKILGLVMSGFGASFGQEFVRGVAEAANAAGYCLMTGLFYKSAAEEQQLIDRLIENGVQGMIVMPIHDGSIANAGILERAIAKFPMVLADRFMAGIRLPYVGTDNANAAFEATRYLFELGHENIGLVSPIPSTTAITEREAGYMRAYAMTNYQIKPSYLVPSLQSSMPGRDTPENFRADVEYMKAYYRNNPEVTALLCIDSNVMAICMTAAAELGLQVPRDKSLVCFDAIDSDRSQSVCTHIRQPEEKMGRVAVELLLESIAGDTEPKHVLLPAVLSIGASTAPPLK